MAAVDSQLSGLHGEISRETNRAAPASTGGLAVSAEALLATLTEAQREQASFRLEGHARATWSNLPIVMAPPAGKLR